MRGIIIAAAAVFSSLTHAADEPHKTPIYVSSSGKDYYAQQLSFHVKELIRASQSMSLVLSEEDATYHVNLIAMDTNCRGVAYAVAYVWAAPKQAPLYQTHTVGTCNQEGLRTCAQSIVVEAAENIENDAKMWDRFFKDAPPAKQ